jgi:hypothetical protein
LGVERVQEFFKPRDYVREIRKYNELRRKGEESVMNKEEKVCV